MTSLRSSRISSLFLAVTLLAGPTRAATWTLENGVMSGNIGWHVDLGRARDGTLLGAFYRTDNWAVAFSRSQDGTWTTTPLRHMDNISFQGAVDRNGDLNVLYSLWAPDVPGLYLARLTPAGTWETSKVLDNTTGNCVLEFDSQNRPHMAYGKDGMLWHRSWNGYAWTDRIVTGSGAAYLVMALDRADKANFTWELLSNDLMYHSAWNGSVYRQEQIMYCTSPCRTMAFDSRNQLHTTFVADVPSDAYYDLMYARFNGTAWTTEAVLQAPAYESTIALDLLDQPHIFYLVPRYDFGQMKWYNDIRHTFRRGASWDTETIVSWLDTVGGPEEHRPLIDPQNRAHVVFTDDSYNLRYAWADLGRQIALAPAFDVAASSTNGSTFTLKDGDIVITTQQYPPGNVWRRGVMEFNISAIPAHLRVSTARLSLRIAGYSSGTNRYPKLSVFGYGGDGIAQSADALNTNTLIGQSDPITSTGPISIPLDSVYISSLLGSATSLGLVLFDPQTGEQAGFYASEAAAYNLPAPALELEYTRATDLEGDGYVDVVDLLTLVASWGLSQGDPLFDPVCDMNRDGAVDVADLLMLVADFGS